MVTRSQTCALPILLCRFSPMQLLRAFVYLKVAWPSGLRRWIKAPVSSEAIMTSSPTAAIMTSSANTAGFARQYSFLNDCSEEFDACGNVAEQSQYPY